MIRRYAWAALSPLALAACSQEPAYVRPSAAVPPAFPAVPGGDQPPLPASGARPVDFREVFRDPRLIAVIERGLANNQNLQVALANVRDARGQLRVARAQFLPAIGLNTGGSIARNRGAAQGLGANGGSVSEQYNATLGLSAFEIDLFGRIASQSNAALAEYLGTVAGVRAARLTLVGETATAYYTLAADRSLLAIANETVASAERTVTLTRARVTGGIAPRTDLRQAETILRQAEADRADLTALVRQDRNALELLVGAPVTDAELPITIESAEPLIADVPAGLDSRVLLGRPDVLQAEYTLRAANARIGAARAAFFPAISLTGLLGFASNALTSLFQGDRLVWNAGGDIDTPIFQGGALRGNLESIEARRDAGIAQYRQSIQTAFREVADALARRAVIADQLRAQTGLVEAAADTLRLSEARYREGIDPFLTTLDAQRTLYNARRALSQARLVRASNLVELYRSLGGGDLAPDTIDAPQPLPRAGEALRPGNRR